MLGISYQSLEIQVITISLQVLESFIIGMSITQSNLRLKNKMRKFHKEE